LKKQNQNISDKLEHAVLSIFEEKQKSIQEKKNDAVSASAGKASLPSGISNKIKNCAKNNISDVSEMVNVVQSSADQNKTVKNFEVQFNPETISFDSSVVETEDITSIEQNKSRLAFGSGEVQTTMHMRLIFDESDFTDNSMHQYTVQKSVEGLIAAIGFENKKYIGFTWGNMSYEGILEGIEAKYVQFAADGMPTRAEVQLSASLEGITAARMKSANNTMGYWYQEYQDFRGL